MQKIIKLFRSFYAWEKKIFWGLILIALFSALMLIRSSYLTKMIKTPAAGGTLVEGILNEAEKIVEATEKLTQSGLVRLDSNGKIIPDLAERWEISPDGKQYKFFLRKNIDAPRAALLFASLKQFKNLGEIKSGEGNTIQINLFQPYGAFLKTATVPFYPLGPYQVSQKNNQEITFLANADFYLGKPYLQKIILKIYPDQQKLDADLRRHKIMAGLTAYSDENFNHFDFPIEKKLYLFFNLESEELKDKTVRQNLANSRPIAKNLSLNLYALKAFKKQAETIKEKFAPLGAKVEIFYYDSASLQSEVLPRRSYDLLIYGVNLGPDPDLYPFFHSSQIGSHGLNLANFSHKTADKLLEEERKTLDENLREQKNADLEKILEEERPVVLLEDFQAGYSIRTMVGGVNIVKGINEADRFAEVWNWYIKTKKSRAK